MDDLEARRLARTTGTEPGQGPRRVIFAPTAAGRREVEQWLASPVEHLRDVRTELLLKLVFYERSGRDPRPLVREQQRTLRPIFAALNAAASRPEADLVDLWRYESADSVRRFLTDAMAVM